MNILVLGGMHGNELLGIELVALIQKNPIDGVETMIANPRAVRATTRFTETDLNRSFGNDSGSYEFRRAKKLKGMLKKYDIVLDFHNTMASDNDSCFVGTACDPVLYRAATQLGLYRCIEATYDCVNKHCTNTLSIEISTESELNNAEYWWREISNMATGGLDDVTGGSRSLELFRYSGRVTWQQKEELALLDWKAFQKIPDEVAATLGVDAPAYPIFVGSRLTEYYATLITKVGTR